MKPLALRPDDRWDLFYGTKLVDLPIRDRAVHIGLAVDVYIFQPIEVNFACLRAFIHEGINCARILTHNLTWDDFRIEQNPLTFHAFRSIEIEPNVIQLFRCLLHHSGTGFSSLRGKRDERRGCGITCRGGRIIGEIRIGGRRGDSGCVDATARSE